MVGNRYIRLSWPNEGIFEQHSPMLRCDEKAKLGSKMRKLLVKEELKTDSLVKTRQFLLLLRLFESHSMGFAKKDDKQVKKK